MTLNRKAPKGAINPRKSGLGVTFEDRIGNVYHAFPTQGEMRDFIQRFRKRARKWSPKRVVAWALEEIG